MASIKIKKVLLSIVLAIMTSFTSYGQQPLWVGQSYTFDVSSYVIGITTNMSWSTSGGYLSLSGSGLYRTITVTQYFSGTATVTCEWDYKLTSNGSYTHTKRQIAISCRDNQVSISPTSMTMSPGDEKYVSYRHQYDNQYVSAANAYFQSSNTSVCTVSSSGKVIAKNPGTAYITVYSNVSSVSPYCRVTVENIKPTSISIPSSLSMTAGEQKVLTASVYPSNAKTSISWITSNSAIATVSSDGTISALKHGTVQITATTDNGLSSSCNVTVNKSKLILSSSHNSGLISKNDGVQLIASNPNATIYYTINGTTPSSSSHQYVEPIIISNDAILKAIAVHPDYLDSDLMELNFEVTSLSLLNTTPEQGERDSAPHLYPCLIFNSSIKEGPEFENIKLLCQNEVVPCEAIINGENLYIVPEGKLDNHFFSVEIPEKAVESYSNDFNTRIVADFDYTTSEINLVKDWTSSSRLMDNGELYVWGYGSYFPTSFGIKSYQGTPVKVLDGIKKYYYQYYITDADVLMGWGDNYNDYDTNPDNSILGDGTKFHRDNPVKISDNVYRIEKGWTGGLLKNDGTLWLWGQNRFGQIGNGHEGTDYYVLSPVQVLSNVKDFSLGTWHSLALKNDGSVWLWGYSKAIGQSSSYSSPIGLGKGFVEIKAGSGHNVLLTEDGNVKCIGENYHGEIGNGRISSYESLYKVMGDVKHIYASYGGSYALKTNGDLYRWGIISRRTSTSVSSPELIASDVCDVYTTDENVAVLKNDNSVWCMGSNSYGLLGLGYSETNGYSTTFSKVFDDVEKVWLLGDKMFVKKTDGSYWGIGRSLGVDTGSSPTLYTKPIEVLKNPVKEVESISLPEILVVEIGSKGLAQLSINPIDANHEDVSWTSFDTSIASISDKGVIYGHSIGETQIEARMSDHMNTYTSQCLVKVVEVGTGLKVIEGTMEKDVVTIYDINGVLVYKGSSSSMPVLKSGLYVISSDSKTIKYLMQ